MPALSPNRRNVLLLAVLLFGQLLLMAGSMRGKDGPSLLESGVLQVTRPVAGIAGAVGGALRGAADSIREVLGARAENKRLAVRVDELLVELETYREQSIENQRLRRLLGMRESLAPQSVGASVITAALSDQESIIVVDRGTEHGVHPDLPVIAWGGAVGRVVSASRSVAHVRLLTDPNSGVAGTIQRTRVEGLVRGMVGDDRLLEMAYVPTFSDVMLGDRVVTSGLDGVFPRGVGIGTVAFVGEESGVSKEIRLRPEVDFSVTEDVLVLLEPVGGRLLEAPEQGGRR